MSAAILHQGDCLPYMQTIKDESVDCIVSDPPYLTNFKTDIYDDSGKQEDELIPQWYNEFYRLLKPKSYCFLYCGILNINKWIDYGLAAGFDYRNMLATRSFTRGGLSAKGNFCFEFQPILVLSKGKGRDFNKVDFYPQSPEWKNDKRNKHPSDFTYSYSNWIPSEITYGTETFGQVDNKEFHPNAKSVKLEQFLIEISTAQEDVVLDPFLGSGTTGVAALQSSRNFIGCELNEHWFKKSAKRISECNTLFCGVKVV